MTGGGLTVIANAPNPAGQAILARYFGGAVLPIWLLVGALLPTLMAVIAFRVLREAGSFRSASPAPSSRRRCWCWSIAAASPGRSRPGSAGCRSSTPSSTASARSRRARVRGDPPWPPRRPPALDVHGAGRVRRLPRIGRDYHALHGDSRFLGQGVVRPIYFAILIPTSCCPWWRCRWCCRRSTCRCRAASPPTGAWPAGRPDLAVRLGHRRRGLPDAADLRSRARCICM